MSKGQKFCSYKNEVKVFLESTNFNLLKFNQNKFSHAIYLIELFSSYRCRQQRHLHLSSLIFYHEKTVGQPCVNVTAMTSSSRVLYFT